MKYLNYIAEIKAFYDLVQVKQLSTGQVALWHALMCINNKCAWIEWFSAPNLTLELLTGLSRKGIYNARNVLKQYNLIDFRTNGTKATSYKMISLQHITQGTTQGTTQDTTQGTTQDSATLIKLNKTIRNETSSNDHLDQGCVDDEDKNSSCGIANEFYETFRYPPNQIQIQMLLSFLDDGLTPWHITEALKRSAKAGARSPTYARTILQDWVNKQAFTPDDVKRLDEKFKPKKVRAGTQVFGDDYEYKPRDQLADGFFPWLDDDEPETIKKEAGI